MTNGSRNKADGFETFLFALTRLVLGLLRREKSEKVGVQVKRMMCGWTKATC